MNDGHDRKSLAVARKSTMPGAQDRKFALEDSTNTLSLTTTIDLLEVRALCLCAQPSPSLRASFLLFSCSLSPSPSPSPSLSLSLSLSLRGGADVNNCGLAPIHRPRAP